MMRRKVRRAGATAVRARRAVLAAVLLAVIVVPLPSLASSQQPPSCRGCHGQPANPERWTARLFGQWAAGDGAAGTVPVSGQAYVAVGGGLALVGDGLTVNAYRLRDGTSLWRDQLSAAAGSAIMSVRAWQGVVTAGIASHSGSARTEVVIDAATGAELRRYPAAVFGGAVAASLRTTVIIGDSTVTSYDNVTGKVRWRRRTDAGQMWRTDRRTLYVTRSAGPLGAAPVTGLQVISLSSGAERSLYAPAGHPFAGTLADVIDGVVLFTSAAGVTAYSTSTGGVLWSSAGSVPEGTDPIAGLVYLTSPDGSLVGVDPATGHVVSSVPGSATTGSAGMYVVRAGVALGLDSGPDGNAWGYSIAAGRVTWTAPDLPWPHYFSALSGIGGSASRSGVVVIAACPRLAPASAATPTPSATQPGSATQSATAPRPSSPSSSPASSPAPSPASSPATPTVTPSPAASGPPVQDCADPELVALNV